MAQLRQSAFAAGIAILAMMLTTGAQTPAAGNAQAADSIKSGASREFAKQLLRLPADQRAIWTSPLRLNRRQASLWIPAAAGTAALVLADHRLYRETSARISPGAQTNLGRFSRSGNPAYMLGLGGGLWLLGRAPSRTRLGRTGLLATRAVIDDLIVVGALKIALGRQRPPGDSFGGPPDGFRSGRFRSLPSGHSSATWAVAAVVSSRHHKRWVPPLLYGFAAAVSVTRVTSGHHFYGDVVAGGLIGYSIGRMVVRSAKDGP